MLSGEIGKEEKHDGKHAEQGLVDALVAYESILAIEKKGKSAFYRIANAMILLSRSGTLRRSEFTDEHRTRVLGSLDEVVNDPKCWGKRSRCWAVRAARNHREHELRIFIEFLKGRILPAEKDAEFRHKLAELISSSSALAQCLQQELLILKDPLHKKGPRDTTTERRRRVGALWATRYAQVRTTRKRYTANKKDDWRKIVKDAEPQLPDWLIDDLPPSKSNQSPKELTARWMAEELHDTPSAILEDVKSLKKTWGTLRCTLNPPGFFTFQGRSNVAIKQPLARCDCPLLICAKLNLGL